MSLYSYYGSMPSFEGAAVVGGIAGFFLVFIILFYLLLLAFSVLVYVLYSLGLHAIAKRRGLRNAWLSWIPGFGQLWIQGSISDQYQYMVKGKVCNKRKSMLWLCIIDVLLFIPAYAVTTLSAIGIGSTFGNSTLAGAGFALAAIAYIIGFILCIVLAVLTYMSLYDLYASCDPSNSALYLILSILISVTLPFLVFSSRKHDFGMQFLHPNYKRQQQPTVSESADQPAAPAPADEPVVETIVVKPASETIVSIPLVEEDVAEEVPVFPVVEDSIEEAPAAEESDPT